MKMIRRIDPLGRILLPKDARRQLRITENDPVEIGIENGRIVIEKFRPLNDMESIAKPVLDTLSEYYRTPVVLCGQSGIIYSAGTVIPHGIKYSEYFLTYINGCNEYVYGSGLPELYIDEENKNKAEALIPLISAKDDMLNIGVLVLLCKSGSEKAQTITELSFLRFAALLIANQVVI